MIDINKPVRRAFYQLWNGQVTIDGSPVPIADEQLKLNTDNNFYVILSSQSSRPDDTKQSSDREATITVDIVTKFNNTVTKDVCDSIADQLFQLLFPFPSSPHKHNLPAQSGLQFTLVRVNSDRHLSLQLSTTQHLIRRILEFSLRVVY